MKETLSSQEAAGYVAKNHHLGLLQQHSHSHSGLLWDLSHVPAHLWVSISSVNRATMGVTGVKGVSVPSNIQKQK